MKERRKLPAVVNSWSYNVWVVIYLITILCCGSKWTTGAFLKSPCVNKKDGIYLHPKKCDWFVKCAGGLAYEQPCSSGLHFNVRTNTCDYPMEAACPYIDSHTNSELFWKKITIGLWGLNNTDPEAIQAKEAEIIHKNLQFNLQTQTTGPLVEDLTENLKSNFDEIPLDDEVHGVPTQKTKLPKSSEKEESYEDEASVKTQDDRNRERSRKNKKSKISKKSKTKITVSWNDDGPKNSASFFNFKIPKDEDFAEIHEVNAGTKKYVYTETVTQPNVLEHHKNKVEITTNNYGKVYDDPGLNIVSDNEEFIEDKIKTKILETSTPLEKLLEEIETKSPDMLNRAKNINQVKKDNNYNNIRKLNDFGGPIMGRNMPGLNIHNQDNWQRWFNGFLPREEHIGRKYQQELLSKMFPKEVSTYSTATLNEIQTPELRSADKTSGLHDDYAPPHVGLDTWQSFTPSYDRKPPPRYSSRGSFRSPSPHQGGFTPVTPGHRHGKTRDTRKHHTKDRYGKHSAQSPSYPGYDQYTDGRDQYADNNAIPHPDDPHGYRETIYGVTFPHGSLGKRHHPADVHPAPENSGRIPKKKEHPPPRPSNDDHAHRDFGPHYNNRPSWYPSDNNVYPSVFTVPKAYENVTPRDFDDEHHKAPFSNDHRQGHSDDVRRIPKRVMNQAKFNVQKRLRSEDRYSHKMQGVVDSMPFRYVTAFLGTKPYAKQIGKSGMLLQEVLKIMKYKHDMDKSAMDHMIHNMPEGQSFLKPLPEPGNPDIHMPVPPDIDYCPYPLRYVCDPKYPYRSVDGSCNNLDHPLFGRSMVPHRRLLYPNYGDGVESSRVSARGGPLPGPRFLSLSMFPDVDRPSQLHTLLLMIWGQFIDHDLTRTAINEMHKEDAGVFETVEVTCGFDGCATNEPGLESCWPIPIPEDDPDFRYNRCLKFVRSQEVPPLNCKLGVREQMNQVTTWIDGSQIYGSTKEESDQLRDYSDPRRGRMQITPHPHGPQWKPLLPQDDMVDICRDTNLTVKCFKAGDERVNEQSGLTAMHTMWMRQHNRIEDALHHINPHWDGERLYQETRKIIGSQIQHIVFNEHLPLLLGPAIMKQYGLNLAEEGFYHHYDPTVDGRIANEFSTAAFRFGHTLIQERFRRSDASYNTDDSLMLSMAFRRPMHIYDTNRGGVDSLVRGLCDFPAQTYDHFFTKQITRSLFTEDPPHGPGMDLMSLNIQRARDHGIQGYNAYRELCGFGRAHDFDDLSEHVTDRMTIATLRRIYKHVDDIDLFVGGVSEASVNGGVVGPTFACILANQFRSLRKGDRFWYENDHEAGFTREQIFELRKTRLAQILCVNGDNVGTIQPWVLLKPFRDVYPDLKMAGYDPAKTGMPYNDFASLYEQNFNARTDCSRLPGPNLNAWRHGPYVAH